MNFFDIIENQNKEKIAPLAQRMKPRTIEEFFGQGDILSNHSLLYKLIKADKLTTVIFYGPPGCGKTSLAKLIASFTKAEFIVINAVTSGIKDIRDAIDVANDNLKIGRRTILFIDEIHRFNKLQQDALLPFVEEGVITLIGSTTENPYYEVNNALISRSTVFRLKALEKSEIVSILRLALREERGLGMFDIVIDDETLEYIAEISGGDARKALNTLELAFLSKDGLTVEIGISKEDIQTIGSDISRGYDKNGNHHYDIISSFIKSVRGSDPDAAIFYLALMLEGGEDPKFIARRLLILASEDIGLADPNALTIANSGFEAVSVLGMPEARITLSEVTIYLSMAPKSNSAYLAIDSAIEEVKRLSDIRLRPYLKDGTSNSLASRLGGEVIEGKYLYPHDYENGYVEQCYLPLGLEDRKYYYPKLIGREKDQFERYFNIRFNRFPNKEEL